MKMILKKGAIAFNAITYENTVTEEPTLLFSSKEWDSYPVRATCRVKFSECGYPYIVEQSEIEYISEEKDQ